jgi:hypothetical protein
MEEKKNFSFEAIYDTSFAFCKGHPLDKSYEGGSLLLVRVIYAIKTDDHVVYFKSLIY